MTIDRRKYLYRIKRLEIKSWLKYLMIEGKHVVDYVLGELTSGTNITINNTVEKKFYKFDVKGNSTQETTTGKNIYDVSLLPVTAYGITISRNENGDIVLNGTPNYTSSYRTFQIGVGKELEIGTYTISVANKKDGIGVNVGGFGGQLNLTLADTVKTKTATSTQAYTINPQINIRYDVGTLTNFVLNPMLEKSSEATSYEPFTYGASPNPSYPQEIYSAGDNGTISEKIVNKNLCDAIINVNLTSGNEKWRVISLNDIKWEQGKTYYIGSFLTKQSNETVQISNYGYVSIDNRVASITFNGNIPAVRVGANTLNGNIVDEEVKIMVATGIFTDFITHQEQLYIVPCQQPMRSIEIDENTIMRDGFIQDLQGNWKERHNVGRVLCIGAQSEEYTREKYEDLYTRFVLVRNDMVNIPANTRQLVISNYFKFASSGSDIGSIFRFNNNIYLYPDKTTIDTVENFKTWLSTHNTEIIYPLATPVDLPCTAEQIAILENLPKSYNEQTNIYSLDVTPAYIEAKAYVKKEEE